MSNGVRSCERRSAHASVIASVVETSGVSGGSSWPAWDDALAYSRVAALTIARTSSGARSVRLSELLQLRYRAAAASGQTVT